MKKSLAFMTVATLLLAASGCGSCKGLFCKSAPVASTVYSPCMPSCAPTCNAAPSCSTDCGCSSPSVTYGYHGAMDGATYDGATFDSTPMSFPTGSGTYGQ